jgi:hypothetical protein
LKKKFVEGKMLDFSSGKKLNLGKGELFVLPDDDGCVGISGERFEELVLGGFGKAEEIGKKENFVGRKERLTAKKESDGVGIGVFVGTKDFGLGVLGEKVIGTSAGSEKIVAVEEIEHKLFLNKISPFLPSLTKEGKPTEETG